MTAASPLKVKAEIAGSWRPISEPPRDARRLARSEESLLLSPHRLATVAIQAKLCAGSRLRRAIPLVIELRPNPQRRQLVSGRVDAVAATHRLRERELVEGPDGVEEERQRADGSELHVPPASPDRDPASLPTGAPGHHEAGLGGHAVGRALELGGDLGRHSPGPEPRAGAPQGGYPLEYLSGC